MALPYRVREATLDDNLQLIELVRRCPIQGTMQLIFDRSPDYFAFTRMQGDRSYVYVAENAEGQLIGSVAFIESQVQSGGVERRVLRFCDLRTDPAYRGSRVAATFIEIYRQLLQSGAYDCGSAEIMEGNISPIKAQRLLGEAIEVVDEGFFEVFQLFPIWSYKPKPRWHLRTAEPLDLPRVAELLQKTYQNVAEAPPFSETWLAGALDQHLSFRLDHLWVAEDNSGKIVAAVAMWDQKGLRRTVALRFNSLARFVVAVLRIIGLVWRLPPTPQEGGSLRYLYLRWPAAEPDAMPALRALIKEILRQTRQKGEHQFVTIGFHEKDSLRTCLGGIFKSKMRMHLYTHRPREEAAQLKLKPELDNEPKRELTTLTANSRLSFHYVDTALI